MFGYDTIRFEHNQADDVIKMTLFYCIFINTTVTRCVFIIFETGLPVGIMLTCGRASHKNYAVVIALEKQFK